MKPRRPNLARIVAVFVTLGLPALVLLFAAPYPAAAQKQAIAWSHQEAPIAKDIDGLREMSDSARAVKTKNLALAIRQLPAAPNKLRLAVQLASLSTEGDLGHDTLQEVATTLADSLREQPIQTKSGQPAAPYVELAQLVRYEHVETSLDDSRFAAAMSKIEADDARRQDANFTLTDLQGQTWALRDLGGKVVLVNFWATWCPPCQKELPDLESLYERFKGQGFVILAISDEDEAKVKPFIAKRKLTYPVLLDRGRKVNDLFQVGGIPRSFVYDRDGKLVAESIDMRTQRQFLELLGQAGLH
jgi:peroxiredoxin